MTGAHAPARDWGTITFYLLVIGAMVVSIAGQVETLAPSIGIPMAILFAVVNDGCAIRALAAARRAPAKSPIKRWAWVAVLLAASSAATLNYWHAIYGTPLPSPARFPTLLGLIAGVEPTLLVLVLSHIVGLEREHSDNAGSDRDTASAARSERELQASRPAAADVSPAVSSAVRSTVSSAPGPDRPAVSSTGSSTGSSGGALVANTGSSPNTTPRGKAEPSRAGPAPRRRLAPAPDQEWMTQALVDDVVASMLERARATRRPYGEGRLVEEHAAKHSPLPDGTELTKHKAREIKNYITRYRLLEAAS